jgi:hypothetical protein
LATRYERDPFIESSELKSPSDHGRGYTLLSMRSTERR